MKQRDKCLLLVVSTVTIFAFLFPGLRNIDDTAYLDSTPGVEIQLNTTDWKNIFCMSLSECVPYLKKSSESNVSIYPCKSSQCQQLRASAQFGTTILHQSSPLQAIHTWKSLPLSKLSICTCASTREGCHKFCSSSNGSVAVSTVSPLSPAQNIPSILVLRDAFVFFKNGAIALKQQKLIVTLNQCDGEEINYNIFCDARVFPVAVHMAGLWTSAFYHGLVEQIPKLTLVLDMLRRDSSIVIIGHKKWEIILQEIYGISNRVVEGNVFCETLYVPEPASCGSANFFEANLMRDILLPRLALTSPGIMEFDRKFKTVKIVIIRRRGVRRIANHEELVRNLSSSLHSHQKSSFPKPSIVEFDEISLPPMGMSQFAVFADADIVIAPHGAGISNMLACSPATALLEFLPDEANLCFWNFAISLGFNYHPLSMKSGFVKVSDVIECVEEIIGNLRQQPKYIIG